MSDYGWIKVHRRSLKHPVFQDSVVWHYWSYLLLNASYEDAEIERGQVRVSLRIAAKETGLSFKQVRRCIDVLVAAEMINIRQGTQKGTLQTLVTILNYCQYQAGQEAKGTLKGTLGGGTHYKKEAKRKNNARGRASPHSGGVEEEKAEQARQHNAAEEERWRQKQQTH